MSRPQIAALGRVGSLAKLLRGGRSHSMSGVVTGTYGCDLALGRAQPRQPRWELTPRQVGSSRAQPVRADAGLALSSGDMSAKRRMSLKRGE